MKKEFYRAVFNKKNIVLVAFIVFIMFYSAYNDGWKTALFANRATDIANSEDVHYYQRYFGNVYRVWVSSYSVIQILIPLLLLIPYTLTYTVEKQSNYRYLLFSREGKKSYLWHKIISIILSGVVIVGLAEGVFYSCSYIFTSHDVAGEYIYGIVENKNSIFYRDATRYFAMIFGMHLVYYAAFLLFSVGVTSFFKNRIAILSLPFLISSAFELIMPSFMQPNVVMLPWISFKYSVEGYIVLVIMYCFIGVICLNITEKLYYRNST
ncbi:MAG: hypothetical protein VZR24_10065 [Butyrivibrio hungatei]|nr:hypothetical protein [Butyrivibrio hungatei]